MSIRKSNGNLQQNLVRRGWLPLVSTAAAVSLVSCAMSGSEEKRVDPTPLPPAPVNTGSAAGAVAGAAHGAETQPGSTLASQVQQYADRVNAALEKNPPVAAGTAGGHGNKTTARAPESLVPGPKTPETPVVVQQTELKVETKVLTPQGMVTTQHTPTGASVTPPPAGAVTPAPVAEAPAPISAPVTHDAVPAAATQAAPVAAAQTGAEAGDPPSVVAMATMAAQTPPAGAPDRTVHAAEAAEVASLDPLLEILRQRVQSRPQAIQYALALQLLESAETARPANQANLSTLAPADAKLVSELATAVQQAAARPVVAGSGNVAERAAPIVAAAKGWQNEDELKLPKLLLASRVDSFGVYTPVEAKFETGKKHVVIIYCEVANFATKKADDGTYITRLAQQDTMVTDDNLLVWRPNPEEIEDRSRNQRHDFYLVKKLTIPDSLAVGKYTLRMSVTDKISNKIALLALPVEIVGTAASGVAAGK